LSTSAESVISGSLLTYLGLSRENL
jgi:hypothetical protein